MSLLTILEQVIILQAQTGLIFQLHIQYQAVPPPTNLNVDNITKNSARFTWTAASPAPVNGYDYYYNTTGIAPTGGASGSVAAGVTNRTQTGLTPNTVYYFWIRSKCAGTGTSSWVYGGYFSTLPDYDCLHGDGQVRGTVDDGMPFKIGGVNRIADDFIVPAGKTMEVKQITIDAISAVSTTVNQAVINIRANSGGIPGAIINSVTMAPTSSVKYLSNWDGYTGWDVYHLTFNLATSVTLNAGTYWLEVTAKNTLNSDYIYWRLEESGVYGAKPKLSDNSGASWFEDTDNYQMVFFVAGDCADAVSCEPVTTSASDPVICAGETTTLTATSSTIGYTYTWYTDWDNDTHTGYEVGTGPSINVNPTESTLYGVVATKAGCPTGVNAAYSLITVAVTPAPELVILDPVEAIACSNEFEQISVVGGGGIPNEAFYENWDTTNINWISKVSVEDIVGDDNLNNAHWMLMSSDSILASPDNSDFTIVGSMFYEDSGDYLMESQLISPPISLLDYNTPVNLTFNHAFWTDGYSEAYVDISTDGGQTWTELKSYTSDVGGPTNFVGETINLNAYAGNPYVLIRFYYLSLWDEWFWAVDDIKITGSPKPTTVTWMVKDSNPVSYAGLYTNASGTTQYTGGHATTLYASPASTTTYTVAASTAVGCPAETEVTVERGDKEWQNTGNTNWNLTSNWNEGGIPTADHCVKIPSMAETRWPVVTSGVHGVAKNVTIQSGGGLTIKGGGSLTVTDIVNNQSSATDNFVIESNANLIQTNDVANTGQVKVEKQFTFSGERKQYNFVSVPVKDADPAGNPSYIKNTIYTPNPTSVQQYNTATYYFDEVNGKYISAKGYAVKEPANPTSPMGIFRGIPFNGHLNYLLSASGGRYNLVGNPYPSNIDLFKLYNDVKNSGANKNNIESNFYFWDNRGNAQFTQQGNDYGTTGYAPSQYAYFNAASGPVGTGVAAPAYSMGNGAGGRIPDRYAKVATGFIVQTKEGVSNPSLNFENDYRTKDGSVSFFGKTMEEPVSDRYWLTMTAPAGISVMNAVVYFEGGLDAYATDDTETFAPDDDLYTIVDGIQCVIQSKRPFTKTDQVPLGYRAFAPGYHYISVYQKEGVFDNGQDIYVIDKVLNKTWNISKEPYRFLTKSGEYNDRFLIVYKPQLTEGGTFAKNEIELVKQNGNIVITSSIDKITNVEIFDLSSRPVYKKSAVNARDFSVNALQFNHQIIVVSVKTETGEVVSKKFVNK